MLTQEANDRYTRVGPGTPTGELMRRYWHPVAAVSQMNDKWTMKVCLLGEDLILYKDRSGAFGLMEPHCAHRRMNMIYGIPRSTVCAARTTVGCTTKQASASSSRTRRRKTRRRGSRTRSG